MGAGGFAACEEERAAEESLSVVRKILGGVVAVLDAGGPGVLGCEAVADGDYGEVEVVGLVGEIWVLAG